MTPEPNAVHAFNSHSTFTARHAQSQQAIASTQMNMDTGSLVVPSLRYRNAHIAIDWLCEAFGFVREEMDEANNDVHHARLGCGGGYILVGSVDGGSEWGQPGAVPDETGGLETQTCCILVEDIDAHLNRAVAAGAEILSPLGDTGFAGRGYSCRDIEGHLWWFGSRQAWSLAPAANA